MNNQEKIIDYWKTGWQDASPQSRRFWSIFLGVYLILWLLGGFLATKHVAAITEMEGLARLVTSLAMGPFGIIWTILKSLGAITESSRDPNIAWLIFTALHVGPLALIIYASQLPLDPEALHKRKAEQHHKIQGQLKPEEAAKVLSIKMGIPLATVKNKEKKPVKVGLDFATGQGHVLITAPTRAGKGLHLTDVLTHWPGAAVVVDPKSEQYRRTAGYRKQHVGPVFHVPGHQVHLAHYYNFRDPDDIQELHTQLTQADEDTQRVFADKSLHLFQAVGHFARAKKLNPLRVLLDAAEDDSARVLRGLESVPAARPFVRQFTNGQSPEQSMAHDRFVSSAHGTFSLRLFAYQKHIDTICPHTPKNTLPREWVSNKSTLYITYSLTELEGVGGVVASILAGLMRDHMAHGKKQRLLVAIDEIAAVQLRHLDTYLATVGGYGITLLIYSQSKSQIEGIYGRAGAESILSNCAHQVWYPPNDYATAKHLSDLYGTTLESQRSYSTANRSIWQGNGQTKTIPQQSFSETSVERPTYSPTALMALPRDTVLVFTERGQQVRFLGQRLDSRDSFNKLPASPFPPKLPQTPRCYTEWSSNPPNLEKPDSSGDEPPQSLPDSTLSQENDDPGSDDTNKDSGQGRKPDDRTLQ